MKNTMKFISTVIIMTLFSCSNEPVLAGFEESNFSKQSDVINSTTVSIQDHTFDIDLMNFIEGASSSIQRNKNGITMNFKTKNLIQNNAYTLWWVVFDNPGPPTQVLAAIGHIAGGNGNGNFSAHLKAGPNTIINPLTSEVHLALRTHGPAQPGMIPEQIHTMDGGCESGFPSGPTLHPDSDIIGYCANIQVAIHPAVN